MPLGRVGAAPPRRGAAPALSPVDGPPWTHLAPVDDDRPDHDDVERDLLIVDHTGWASRNATLTSALHIAKITPMMRAHV